jgi:MoaA/NifB/PqqE/SkfB family radical SAM enzyme
MADSVPLVTLYLSERCNSRCVTCDYWRHGAKDMTLASVRRLLPALAELRTRAVLVSGGEPLLNPEWREIAELLKSRDLTLWLLTSGLSLAKHARARDVHEPGRGPCLTHRCRRCSPKSGRACSTRSAL